MFFNVTTDHPVLADQYRIVHIDRHSTFAGKQGREVRETWTVSKDGKEYTVVLSPYHTAVSRTVEYREGDTVTIRSSAHDGRIRACLSDVGR